MPASPSTQPPAPAEAAAPAELDAVRVEVDTVRRKVDDVAALTRRNQQALTELAESVGRLVTQQRRRERGFTLNSFVAYLVFTVLLGGGFFLLYRSRAGELVAARDRAVLDRDDARRRAGVVEAELAARSEGAARALAYWKLLEQGELDAAIAQYPEVAAGALTGTERELFAARHRLAREQVVDAGYLSGIDSFRAGDLAAAIRSLEGALGYEEEGPRAANMRYYVGVAQVKTAAAEAGVKNLELALAGRVEDNGVVDTRYWLATGLEALGRVAEARAEYDRFATAQPTHPLSVGARRKSAALARLGGPRN